MSYDGRRSLFSSNPGSARSLSREGDGLIDFGAVLVGKGSLEAGRGMPLVGRGIPLKGRFAVLGCPSMMIQLLALVDEGEICQNLGTHIR